MTLLRADLHCHSSCSDGSLTPSELLQNAVDSGLQGLSITDHDTVDAYETAFDGAKALGLTLISGVEFSTALRGQSIHILGYAFDPDNPALRYLCERHTHRREDRLQKILERLCQEGFSLNEEDVRAHSEGSSIGRPHIAAAMMEKGYVHSIKEAFQNYLAEGKPCYVPGALFSPEETIDVIHGAQGKAVIAHPHLIKSRPTVNRLLQLDFDGIECYYARFPPDQERPWLKLAEKRALLVTGGSDFHGSAKPHLPLGCSWAPEDTFLRLMEHFHKVCPQ